MSEICVVHLVWSPLGLKPFEDFVASYRERGGGMEHRLAVVFNGFGDERDADAYRRHLAGINYDALFVSPPTHDIPAYLAAARKFADNYFCFLNSYSVPLDPNWLAKMYAHARAERVGLVGASGSWESFYTNFLREVESIESRPHETAPPRASLRLQLTRAYYKARELLRPKSFVRNKLGERQRRRALKMLREKYDPFPNYHIRTNAFMLRRERLLNLDVRPMRQKQDAWEFESGRRSMTRQILDAGWRALVVGRDGEAYEKERWRESRTFRSGAQENLLISDNRTREYAEAEPQAQRRMSENTWGRS